MKKTIMMAIAAVGLASVTTGALAAKSNVTPFDDALTVQLIGFPNGTMFFANYEGNNGVNISGPDFFTTDGAALVKVFSDNKMENGFPVMTISYPTSEGTEQCTLNLVDGPWVNLNYKNGQAPTCSDITLSAITPVSQYGYSLTITNTDV